MPKRSRTFENVQEHSKTFENGQKRPKRPKTSGNVWKRSKTPETTFKFFSRSHRAADLCRGCSRRAAIAAAAAAAAAVSAQYISALYPRPVDTLLCDIAKACATSRTVSAALQPLLAMSQTLCATVLMLKHMRPARLFGVLCL